MLQVENEIQELRDQLIEMWDLTIKQLDNTESAFKNFERDLALEVQQTERRVNAFELTIDRACENFIALFQPVATDLRFVLSTLKINTNLERIADIACGISEFVSDSDDRFNAEIIKLMDADKMLTLSIEMLKELREAYILEDTKLARTVYKKDKMLDKLNDVASYKALECLEKFPDEKRQTLHVLSIIRKIERVGDQAKNIAEEIIFYLDAKILKHKKKEKEIN
ncbi:MAG: phosphate signaling complex protein PhoU [Saprospiraceae bacterium]|nr:phosphate signaling complex protein PhoU [Saprospiraceae bacterium]MBK7738705.1 phosphate signaling complex protein PhoU [Saprospiraceae bacterium]MBK7912723.1 phosphate signaling complex protein PhoU [Saprospiraceae bacterium]